MRTTLRNNGLAIAFLVLCLLSLGGQAVAGHAKYNAQEREHARLLHERPQTLSLGRYVTSASYAQAVTENWQSEYLQFAVFIWIGIHLVQRGSTESKTLDAAGSESDEEQRVGRHADPESPEPARAGGWQAALFGRSLLFVMLLIFLGSWFAQSVAGWSVYNQDQADHREAAISYGAYLLNPDFWEASLQNWQSEFLSVGSIAVFSIFLRQRGSSQSKPVGAHHMETSTEG
jgi:hypothetical protein